MSPETIPAVPGTYYGELSPEGQWFWNGTGKPDDQWIANSQDVPVQQVQPTIKGTDHYIMNPTDVMIYRDHSSKGNPPPAMRQVMNPADFIKAYNLTG